MLLRPALELCAFATTGAKCPPSTGRGRRTRLCGCRPVPCAARQDDPCRHCLLPSFTPAAFSVLAQCPQALSCTTLCSSCAHREVTLVAGRYRVGASVTANTASTRSRATSIYAQCRSAKCCWLAELWACIRECCCITASHRVARCVVKACSKAHPECPAQHWLLHLSLRTPPLCTIFFILKARQQACIISSCYCYGCFCCWHALWQFCISSAAQRSATLVSEQSVLGVRLALLVRSQLALLPALPPAVCVYLCALVYT